jgi:cell fate (sporulation/competence/biofilm development) regulator YmcA (YheA/YmcA/DUF963 family)
MAAEKDSVHRRITVEYGQHYAYITIQDRNGRIIEEEAFKQPFRLEFKDTAEEASECFQYVYQYLQDTVLWYSTARDDPPEGKSEEPPETD